MKQILTVQELQQDVADLLDYLHTTPESFWDYAYIKQKIMENMKRFNESIIFYHIPLTIKDFSKITYSKDDLEDLIASLTNKYVAIGKLKLKPEYKRH